MCLQYVCMFLQFSVHLCMYSAMCVCVCMFSDLATNEFCIDMHTRTPTRPTQAAFIFFMFCFLRCSDDTFLSRLAHCGSLGVAEERRRGGQHGADAFLSGDKGPLRHPLFSSPLRSLQLSSAAHQSGALHMKRAPSLCHAN